MLDALAAAAVDVPLDQPLSASASAPLGPEPDTLRERRESGGASDDIDTLPARAPTPARAHELSESRATGGQGDGEDEDGIQVIPHERTGRSPGGVGRARRGSEGDSAMLRPSGGALPARAAARESSSPAAFAEVAPSSRPTERPHARHRWATMAALLALTGGIGATVALLAAQGGGHAAGKEPILVIAADAGPSGGAATADLTRAAADREPPRDAGAAPPSSARESGKAHTANGRKAGVLPRRDAHPHATDAGGSEVLGRGPDVEMKVITDPAGGRLIHDDIDGGPDGTNFRRPEGTRLDVECRKYENLVLTARGKVRLDFDGQSHLAICHMAPLPRKKCLPGLKNPLDDCP